MRRNLIYLQSNRRANVRKSSVEREKENKNRTFPCLGHCSFGFCIDSSGRDGDSGSSNVLIQLILNASQLAFTL